QGSSPAGSAGSDSGNAGATGGSGAAGSRPPLGTTGPHFPGSGNGFRPLTPGCGPETATQCTGSCEQQGGLPTTVIRPPATLCFSGKGDTTPEDPSVVIEQVIERRGTQAYVHIRVTFDPAFTDNTFGAGSCCGWPLKRGHRFSDLTGSDHTELLLTNGAGETTMNFKVDLITQDAAAGCGFGTLGVTGGDGSVIKGDAGDVLAVATSLDRNLNGCDYCASTACGPSGDCTIDSPATDESYKPNPATPNWDYRQVYEVWIALDAFGTEGFGQAYVTYTHSSPAKTTDTIVVEPSPCPPTWDSPYCPPGLVQEGGNCFGSPPSGGGGNGGSSGAGNVGGNGGSSGAGNVGGTSSAGGARNVGGSGSGRGGSAGSSSGGGSGGGSSPCQPNSQIYVTSEGAAVCTPIPFSNYPGMAPCPSGYALDLASEGQYCLPTAK
ncbi:MAG TPA: hypothetical protein VER33_18015, partial [Polyangiaceae bacterium]|nr:hypothetical protein [Polyangiaceae bacterium]